MIETLNRMLKILKQLEYEYETIKKDVDDNTDFTYRSAIKSFKESIFWYKEYLTIKGIK